MTRQQAIDNLQEKRIAKENAWKAVRANRTDFELDVILRAAALKADEEYRQACNLQVKYAPSI